MMLKTLRDARQLVRRQPVLLVPLAIGLFFGLYSEGLERLWTAHLLKDFSLPWASQLDPVVWFGVIRAVALVISIAATEVARRRVDTRCPVSIGRALLLLAALIIVALSGSLVWPGASPVHCRTRATTCSLMSHKCGPRSSLSPVRWMPWDRSRGGRSSEPLAMPPSGPHS
jgi:hypothetical protein